MISWDRASRWMFDIGVLWLFVVIILGSFGVIIVIPWSYPAIPMIFIPKFLWSFGILKDPFDLP